MDTKYLVVAAVMSVMLIGATALAIEDAFATERNIMERAKQQHK
jgi:hypothetical protein